MLTQPDSVIELHLSYLLAGADIITTNTFSSTTVAQREYGLDDPALIIELNHDGCELARTAADDAERRDGRPPLDRRRTRADQRHAVTVATRRGPGVPHDDLSATRRVRTATRSPGSSKAGSTCC